MPKRAPSLYLFIASFVSAIGLYLFYIKYRLDTLPSSLDSSFITPLYRPEVRIEADMPLYVIGVIFIFLLTLLLYFFLSSLIRHFSEPVQILSSRLFLKLMIVIDIVIYYFLVFVSIPQFNSLPILYLIFVLIYLCLVFIFFIVPQKLEYLLIYIDRSIDWFLIFGVFLLDIFLIYEILFETKTVNNLIIYYFRKEELFPFFTGFSQLQFLLIAILISILFVLWFRPLKEVSRWASFSFVKYFVDFMVFLAIIFFVSIVVVNGWGYPNYVIVPNYNPVIGPINDVLGGKSLLVNINSQYGLLYIYTLAFLFRFIPLTYSNFFWLCFVVAIAGYYLLYIVMRKWLGWIAILGIALIIGFHYFGAVGNILLLCQQTFLRFGWWIILLLFIVFEDKIRIKQRIKFFIEILIVTTAIYWAFDSGLYVLGGYLGFVSVRIMIKKCSWMAQFKEFTFSFLNIVIAVTIYFIAISLFTYFRAGVSPDWSRFNSTAAQFAGGIGLIPMPAFHPYLVVLGLYSGVLLYIFYRLFFIKNKLLDEKKRDLCLISLTTFYGMSQFIYYTGRSTSRSLLIVCLPFIIIFCWVLAKCKNYYKKHGLTFSQKRYKLLFWELCAFLLITSSFLTTITTANIYSAYGKRDRLIPLGFDDIANEPTHRQSIDYINKYLEGREGKERKIAILSTWDGFFLTKTKSVNVIDSNNLDYFVRISQLDDLGRQLRREHPDIILVDHMSYFEMVPYIVNYVKDKYHFEKNVGYLDEMGRN